MSGSDDSNDLSAIAWPGFVDILSAVIIMFVFFVLIIAVVLYFHVITYKSKVQTDAVNLAMEAVSELEVESRSQKTQKADESAEMLEVQVAELKQKNEALEKVVSDLKKLMQSRAEFSESETQTYIKDSENGRFVIFFGHDAITLTKETLDVMEKFVEEVANRYNLSESKAIIKGGVDQRSKQLVATKKLAIARMLNARNVMIKSPVPRENITINIDAGRDMDGDYNWVEVIVEPQ